MIRIREILDPDLKAAVVAKLAAWRGLTPAAVPEWFELDDADYSDLLLELHDEERSQQEHRDPRM